MIGSDRGPWPLGATVASGSFWGGHSRVREPIAEIRVRVCSASGSTHTESGKLYRKVKHRARPKVSSR